MTDFFYRAHGGYTSKKDLSGRAVEISCLNANFREGRLLPGEKIVV